MLQPQLRVMKIDALKGHEVKVFLQVNSRHKKGSSRTSEHFGILNKRVGGGEIGLQRDNKCDNRRVIRA